MDRVELKTGHYPRNLQDEPPNTEILFSLTEVSSYEAEEVFRIKTQIFNGLTILEFT